MLRTFLCCLPCCSMVLVAGCSAPAGEQAARVNGVKITREEVELVREHADEATDEAPGRKRLLDGLIVKELLAQQFLRTVGGSAAVSEQAVNVARRELLAQRYIARLTAAVAPPAAEQVSRFYRTHPQLFAGRVAFSVRTLDVVLPPGREPELRAQVRAAATLEDVVGWLRGQGLGFSWSETVHHSDELAEDSLAQLLAMRERDVALMPMRRGVRVIQLVGSHPAGMDEATAAPLIRARLWAELRDAAIVAEVERLTRLAAISISDGPAGGDSGRLVSLPHANPAASSPSAHLPSTSPASNPPDATADGTPDGGNLP